MFSNVVGIISYLVYQLFIPAIFTVSFIVFLWGLLLFVVAGSADGELGGKGQSMMLYAILTLVFMMVLVWLAHLLGLPHAS